MPVLCGQRRASFGYRETRSIRELAQWLLEPGHHWAHNGGRFDTLAVLDVWRAMGESVTAVFAGGRIIAARARDSVLCDSAALWPCSLHEVTTGTSNAKLDFPLRCQCGENCGGYCALRLDMGPGEYAAVSEYLRRDCESLFGALSGLVEFAAENDIDLALTVGAAGFASAKRQLGFEADPHSLTEHAFRRRAYYGGRTQTFQTGPFGHGHEYDVIGMYPSMLASVALPVGPVQHLSGRHTLEAFRKRRPGIYTVGVSVPESHIPPLPFRTDKRLWYPHGDFDACYTLPELESAIENDRIRVRYWGDSRVYSETRVIFAEWIERMSALRMRVGKSLPQGIFLKFIQNSVYGKLASKPDKLQLRINPARIRGCKLKHNHESRDCMADIIVADGIYARKRFVVDECAHPIWAAYVTSHSRLKLRAKLLEGGAETSLYCDTDSVFSLTEKPIGVNPAPGNWEKKSFSAMHIIAPKVYGLNRDGCQYAKAKGIQLRLGDCVCGKDCNGKCNVALPEVGREYKQAGVKGAKSIGKRESFFARKTGTRILTSRTGDRISLPGGQTRPPHISECED